MLRRFPRTRITPIAVAALAVVTSAASSSADDTVSTRELASVALERSDPGLERSDPALERSDPALARILPEILEVPQVPSRIQPMGGPADRDFLLQEFPDALVEELWLQDWMDLERAYEVGRLVDVRSDPDGVGIELRLDGWSRIGELETDPYRQMLLCRLSKPAAGLLYQIADRLRLIEGDDYEPLEVTSLVRTWHYQLRLGDVNPNADRTREGVPPTHVLGLAFDIARSSMNARRQERIEFLFDQLAREGQLAYYKEGSSNGRQHYHVMALPRADRALARFYDRETGTGGEAVALSQRYLPDSPCVTFGAALEPSCSICSCELPLEALAAGVLAGAPISR